MSTTTAASIATPTEGRPPATTALHVVARHGRTVVASSRSGVPLGLRELRGAPGERALRVGIVQTGAMLVGGDDVCLSVTVGPAAVLVLQDISATVAHPMRSPVAARQRLELHVADGGRAVVAEEPLVVAASACVRRDVRIALSGDARVLHRDTLVLGRWDEDGGAARTRTRVERDGRPLLDDAIDTGIDHRALRSSAVLGGARVIASLAAFGAPPEDRPDDALLLASGDVLVRRLARDMRGLGDLDAWQRIWQGSFSIERPIV